MWSVQKDALGQGSLALTLILKVQALPPRQEDLALKVVLPSCGTDTAQQELLNPLLEHVQPHPGSSTVLYKRQEGREAKRTEGRRVDHWSTPLSQFRRPERAQASAILSHTQLFSCFGDCFDLSGSF